MSDHVVVRDVVRRFGAVRAVDGLSFSLPAGSVTGMIGANGAGKTTTLRMLATLEEPDAGSLEVCGASCRHDPDLVRRHVGWMPDHVTVVQNTTVLDFLDFFARAHGLRGAARATRLEETIHFTDLQPLLDRPMRGLSKGQMQRLALARTLLHDPQVLLLDEPAAGLDPQARVEFRGLVHLLRERGKTLLISSHILSELGEMCDRLIFMDAGRLLFSGPASELHRTQRGDAEPPPLPGEIGLPTPRATSVEVQLRVLGSEQDYAKGLAQRPGWTVLGTAPGTVRAEFFSDAPEALAGELTGLCAEGRAPWSFTVKEASLEQAFINVLKRERNDGERRKSA